MPRFAPPSLTTAQLEANSPSPIYVGELARASDTGHIWSACFVGDVLMWLTPENGMLPTQMQLLAAIAANSAQIIQLRLEHV